MTGIYKGIASVGGVKLAALAISFGATALTVRIIVGEYGEPAYGGVTLVATLITLIPFADLGLGIALTNLTVDTVETGTSARLRLSASATFWILVAVAGVLILVSCALSATGAWASLLGPPATILGDANQYMLLYALFAAVWLVGGPGFRLLAGLRRTNTLVVVQSIAPIFAALATLLAAAAHAPIIVFAFFPLAGAILSEIIGWIVALSTLHGHPSKLVPFRRIRRNMWARVLHVGMGGFAFSAAGLLMFAVDRVLLSHLGGADVLGSYAVAVPLFTATQSALGSIGTYLWPRYTLLRRRGALTRDRLRRDTLMFSGFGMLLLVAVPALFPLYSLLVGTGPPPMELAVSFGALAMLQCSSLPLSSSLTSDQMIRAQGAGLAATLVVKIGLSAVLVPAIGATGVVLASVVSIASIQIPWLMLLGARSTGKRTASPE